MSRRYFLTDKTYRNIISKSKSPDASLLLSETSLRAALQLYGVAMTPELAQAIRRYSELLLLWNKKVNLTAITRPMEILTRHFGESMLAATLLPLQKGRLADVGSGAGFPGLALKLLGPALEVLLIEPNLKKSAFLAEVVRSLHLSGVEIIRDRIEDFHPAPGSFDFITSRAVGNLDRLLAWSRRMLSSHGHILMWLGENDARVVEGKLGWTWQEPVRIPGSIRRVVLVGRPDML